MMRLGTSSGGSFNPTREISYVRESQERSWIQKKIYLMSQVNTQQLWRHITIPVLALYGGHDLNVPAAKKVSALDQELKKAGNLNYTIKVFPNADHYGFETSKALMTVAELRRVDRHVDGCFSPPLDYVLRHVVLRHVAVRR